ncbi:MAG: hypothetical protein ACRD5I_06845 [Candidatus Acidiferrales bacterium]
MPVGRITVLGPGVECTYFDSGAAPPAHGDPSEYMMEVCNVTTITVQINGQSVSVNAQENSTQNSVAVALATAIMSNPTLFQQVVATVSGNQITISARLEGVQYAYAWQSSCYYNSDLFQQCAFRTELAPMATLAPE